MAQLSDAVRERMRQQARAAQDASSGGGHMPKWNLTGKKAVVQPGEGFVGRVLPRWDVANRYVQKDGQWVSNPEYVEDFVYFVALEHWWDDRSGKSNQEWCPKTFDEAAPCPICDAAAGLMTGGDAERKLGKRQQARKSYLYNFLAGKTGKRLLTDRGAPDIRVLPASNTIFVGITKHMTGGLGDNDDDAAAFAKGDITDPRDGYDVKLNRPKADGERWSVDCAPNPSPLFMPAEAAAFQNWGTYLIDIPAVLQAEMKSWDGLYESYYGCKPDADGGVGDATDAGSDGFGSAPPPAPQADPGPADPWGSYVPPASSASAQAPATSAPFDPPPGARTPPRRPSGRR